MRYRWIAALTAALALAFTVATAAAQAATSNTLTVWLQVDAQNGWPDVVAAANSAFEASHPGWTVNVDYQQWSDHLAKFDATIAGNDTPDVIEMGNTEMTKYMAEGAFANLGVGQVAVPELEPLARRACWRPRNITTSCTGFRTTRAHASSPTGATCSRRLSIKRIPKSLAQLQADLVKVGKMEKKNKGFSPLYVGGEDWYTALGFVFDYGGSIAKYENGKWVGTLDSKNSIKGLTAFQQFFDATQSKSTATLDGTNPYAVHGLLGGQDGRELRPGLVLVLYREAVRKGHRSSS